ncbi:hypothetical protein KSS87_023100, partial [Heliosperma pusillum]
KTQGAFNVLASSLKERLDKRTDERLMALVQPLLKRIGELEEQIVVYRAAVAGSAPPREASTRIKVPLPPKFNGSRDAKEIDNFLCHEIGGGDRQSSTIKGDGTRAKEATRDQSHTEWRGKGKTFNCFLCGGPHMVRECPERAKISAMMMRYEDKESLEAHEPRRLGAMILINVGVVDKPTGLAIATKLDVEPTLKATRSVESTLKATGVVSKEPVGLDATTNCDVEPT